MHKIKITNCKNHIEEITLTNGTHTIGRSLDSTLRLEGDEVSRLHARLLVNQTLCELVDEESKNGTFVNGNRISSYYLKNNDAIQIGKFNLQFISDVAKPHLPTKKRWKPLIFFIAALIPFLYQMTVTGRTKLQLANRTAQYLAERNKEALYLGEYTSIDLTNLPPEIKQVAIWDRNGVLRAHQPLNMDPLTPPSPRGTRTSGSGEGKGEGIHIPIYYESVQVGTLWVKYRL